MTLAWFGCQSGASGDMVLGALVGAGASLERMQAAVDAVVRAGGLERIDLTAAEVDRGGLRATKVDVMVPASEQTRRWAGLRGLLERADLDDGVRSRSLDVFTRLARAEGAAHGVAPEDVHFHEVGALDAVADVVGASAGLADLGVTAASASPVTVGGGTVRTAHGVLPVPGPAVLALLQEAGAPVRGGEVEREMCTPTGAALLAATVDTWGGLPQMRVTATGLGAGSRDLDGMPNVLRLVLGEPAPSAARSGAEPVVEANADLVVEANADLVVEANVDDLDPRLWPGLLQRLLAAGASDAWLTPILMKKGRPAHTLSVLTPAAAADAVRRVVFTESSSIGVREHVVGKHALDREVRTVTVDGVDIRVKVALLDGEVVNASPEYDDVAAAAVRLGRPEKAVLAAASAAAQRDLAGG